MLEEPTGVESGAPWNDVHTKKREEKCGEKHQHLDGEDRDRDVAADWSNATRSCPGDERDACHRIRIKRVSFHSR